MIDMNIVVLTGTVIGIPDLHHTGRTPVLRFLLGVFGRVAGEPRQTEVPITWLGNDAAELAERLARGDRVSVEGSWERRAGRPAQVLASRVRRFLDLLEAAR